MDLMTNTVHHKRGFSNTMLELNSQSNYLPNITMDTLNAIKDHKKIITGSAIDKVGINNEKVIKVLEADLKLSNKQSEELRFLNEKLVERLEHL